jgi:SAM-dependent methyltransferase
MARALAGPPAVRVADVGCGTRRYMIKLTSRLAERLHVYSIDLSRGMLAELRDRLEALGICWSCQYCVETQDGRLFDLGLLHEYRAARSFGAQQVPNPLGLTCRIRHRDTRTSVRMGISAHAASEGTL